LLTAIGLIPGGSTHLHTNNTQNNTNNIRTTQITNNVEECGPCPVFASFYPGICLTTEEKALTVLSQGKTNLSQVNKNLSQSTVYILPRHPHITKPTQTHTLQSINVYWTSCEVRYGKAIPLQAWTGPEGSRRVRLPDFKTIGT
jgi:hypothetical protein